MSYDRKDPVEQLVEVLAYVPIEAWYDAVLQAKAVSRGPLDVGLLWRAADRADPMRTWELADTVETLYYRLNTPAAVKRLGGKEGCDLLRQVTELAIVRLAFPDLTIPADAMIVAEAFRELLVP